MSLEMSRDDIRDGAIYFEGCWGFQEAREKTENREKDEALGLGLYQTPSHQERTGDLDRQDGRRSHSKHQLPGARRRSEGL